LVSNFKGGNASSVEPVGSLAVKLVVYRKQLQEFHALIDERPLGAIATDLGQLQRSGTAFLALTGVPETSIKGFGPANASALLACYFPETLPVIDSLVLLGAGIEHSRNRQGQVVNIDSHYAALLGRCQEALAAAPQMSLRQLDRKWFQEGQTLSKALRNETASADV
jgi:hypothetical protein